VARDLRINNKNTEERKLKLKELLEEHGDRVTNRGVKIEWGMESLVLIYYLLEKLRKSF
jgi:Ni,Fe-hydrogenase III large subunit